MKIPRTIFKRPLEQELGFGKNMTNVRRMMNSDGSFNVERQHLSLWDNTYFHLVTMPWWRFFLLVFLCYVLLNLIFSALYLLVGVGQLQGIQPGSFWQNFTTVYFFSTQTLTTVGYGHISPVGLGANILSALESFTGLLAFALISGLLYGRFSRPKAKIVFSENMLIAPYRSGRGLMFRMANARKSELIETEVTIILAMNQAGDDGNLDRRFYGLKLEISRVSFFSLSWTVVHDLNEDSPLWGFSEQDLLDANAEVMVLVKGTEDVNQQIVHARRSYVAEDIVWNARFQPVIGRNRNGIPQVLSRVIGAHEVLN